MDGSHKWADYGRNLIVLFFVLVYLKKLEFLKDDDLDWQGFHVFHVSQILKLIKKVKHKNGED